MIIRRSRVLSFCLQHLGLLLIHSSKLVQGYHHPHPPSQNHQDLGLQLNSLSHSLVVNLEAMEGNLEAMEDSLAALEDDQSASQGNNQPPPIVLLSISITSGLQSSQELWDQCLAVLDSKTLFSQTLSSAEMLDLM